MLLLTVLVQGQRISTKNFPAESLDSCRLQFLHSSSQSNLPPGVINDKTGREYSSSLPVTRITGEAANSKQPKSCSSELAGDNGLSETPFKSIASAELTDDLLRHFEVSLVLFPQDETNRLLRSSRRISTRPSSRCFKLLRGWQQSWMVS